jgi:signal transduction histidine kinase
MQLHTSKPTPPGQGVALSSTALGHAVLRVSAAGQIEWANDAAGRLTGFTPDTLAGSRLEDLARFLRHAPPSGPSVVDAAAPGARQTSQAVLETLDGQVRFVDVERQPVAEGGCLLLLVDVTDRVQFEQRLSLAERMAAIGTLASGVAHEIATPVQFVGDSVQFLRDAVKDVTRAMETLRQVRAEVLTDLPAKAAAEHSVSVDEDTDVDYLLEHMPQALDSCIDGLDRVGTILKSLKEYAHPQNDSMTSVDINALIERTLTLARNEYKYVADVETSFGALPEVHCIGGHIGQVILNLLVNASHAIGDVVEATGGRGTIAVTTCHEGDDVRVSVRDTGAGIPDTVLPRIFEPFFTTKAVGKGSGQGLALAWRVIVEKHRGSIDIESTVGAGTTFHLRIPVAGPSARPLTQVAA